MLWVLCDNARARRFYQRLGFTHDGALEPITLGKALMEMRYRRLLEPLVERFDILNADGKPTGRTARRGDLLEQGAFYLGVHAYIYDPARGFLLQRRAMGKAFMPGGWETHMGHVLCGEQSLDAVRRELREELGISIPLEACELLERVAWPENHHFMDLYWVEIDAPLDELSPDPAEVIGVRYISPQEMLDMINGMYYRPSAYRALIAQVVRGKLGL